MSMLLIHYGLEFFARRSPAKTALWFGDESLTFAQLNARANRVAHALQAGGLAKGDRVGAFLDNCPEYPEIIYGCSKVGMVLVPINYRLTSREAHALLSHADARVVFISQRLDEALGDERKNFLTMLGDGLVTVGQPGKAAQGYSSWVKGHAEQDPRVHIDERDPFYIGYTSGTTGLPKGALIPHRARGLLMLANAIEYGLTEDDVNITPGAIYHAAPIIMMLLAINIGGTTVIMPNFDAEDMLRLIEAHGATNAFVAPTMLHMIHQLPDRIKQHYDLSSVRMLLSAGAPLSMHDKQATQALFGENVLHEYYGSTEAGWNLSLRPRDQLARPRSCGKPTLGWDVTLLDDDGEPVTEPGAVGELHVRGDHIFDGYIGNPQATRDAFRGEWFSAGDLACRDEEGFFYIVGRKKDMIISGGANIYPEEIEDCLHGCPSVLDVAVIGLPDDTWGECVTAVMVLESGRQLTLDDIRDFCEGRMASYKRPRGLRIVDVIPRNPSGKIQKNMLRERFTQTAEPSPCHEAGAR